MHTLDYYSNKDIDANLMVQRLQQYTDTTTSAAKESIKQLEDQRNHMIRNYKDTALIERTLGTLRLLINNRELWSEQGAFDDCSHWVGNMNKKDA